MKNEIKKLTDREHILLRPQMYLGSVNLTETEDFVLDTDKIVYKTIKFVPAFIKIINEIIDNSVDACIRTDFKFGRNISVKISDTKISVEDDGTGIPVKQTDGIWMPELAWGHAKAGSNFDDSNRLTIGMNGVGSFCTNVFSKVFKGITDDGTKRFGITFKNNAESSKFEIQDSKSRGTFVEFTPDLEKFGLTEIDATHKNVILQRLQNLAISYPEINFKFNGKLINFKSFKNYLKLFGDSFEVYETDNIKIGVFSSPDDFKQFSYVNGLKIPDGGTHIDVISNNIISIIKDKLIRKYKSIKPGDIKNKLQLVVFINRLPNAKFNSQTKEKLTNSVAEFNRFSNIDYSFVNKVLKNDDIISPIIEVYKIKEELENRKALKSVEKTKKLKSDKYFRSTNKPKYLCICEGFSAYGGLAQVLGNTDVQFYVLKGKPLNCQNVSIQKLMSNVELSELLQIFNNELEFVELTDGDFYELSINDKTYIVNENDILNIDGQTIDISNILKNS